MAPPKSYRRNRKHHARKGAEAAPTGQAPLLVAIDSLAWGGDGVGRCDGKVIFTPLTAPGDQAEVSIVADHRSYARASLRKLLREGPGRVAPPCPVFGACGGCQWQHVAYEEQLAAKGSILADALSRIGKLALPGELRVVPSPQEYGYRHRTRLQVRSSGEGPALGFFRTASHDIVPVEKCPLLQESLNKLLLLLTKTVAKHPRFFRKVADLSLATDFPGRQVRVAISGRSEDTALPAETAQHLAAQAGKRGIDIFFAAGEERPLALGPGQESLLVTGNTFTQVNLPQNLRLVEEVVSLARPAEGETVLDLYCGTGNFTFPLAGSGASVLGIDTGGPSIRCARQNARRLEATVEFRRDGAESAVATLAAEERRFDLVVLNPPRAGAKEAVAELHRLRPSRVVMISCDPATFARDAATLNGHGYTLSDLRAFDLFPQTFHFETVGLFTR
jgi:23S rRNA (uracil1939-C5)-methyltransferase